MGLSYLSLLLVNYHQFVLFYYFFQVYHHASILLLSDYAYHFNPWPAIGVMLGLNSFVHVFLYLYYGQAALNPSQRPQWKQQMTQLQMFQFVIGLIHSSVGYLHHGFCVYSIFYGFSMLGLFGNFYYHAFLKVRRDKKIEWVNFHVSVMSDCFVNSKCAS